MPERVTEPEVAWYRLSRGNVAAVAAISLVLVVLCALLALGGSGAAPPDVSDGSLPPVRIYVNRASAAELMALPGIGERKAERIVRQREAKPLKDMNELAAAAGGIPAAQLERMRPFVSFDTP
ncbi:MAG: helix-hairpin-helix domain-containing protein [Planctomycetes bacterium]|nr:helix-hairpin-helix domain-containing protein [Planctomycetota bacterium]MCW8135298.1 helix-hairpin-helix domain-containing protein [Planctomycetota bacterium]